MKEIGFSPEKLHSIALDAIEQGEFDFSNGGTKFVTKYRERKPRCFSSGLANEGLVKSAEIVI